MALGYVVMVILFFIFLIVVLALLAAAGLGLLIGAFVLLAGYCKARSAGQPSRRWAGALGCFLGGAAILALIVFLLWWSVQPDTLYGIMML